MGNQSQTAYDVTVAATESLHPGTNPQGLISSQVHTVVTPLQLGEEMNDLQLADDENTSCLPEVVHQRPFLCQPSVRPNEVEMRNSEREREFESQMNGFL